MINTKVGPLDIYLEKTGVYLCPTMSAIGKSYLSTIYQNGIYLDNGGSIYRIINEKELKRISPTYTDGCIIVLDKFDLYRDDADYELIDKLAESNYVLIDVKYRGAIYHMFNTKVRTLDMYRDEKGVVVIRYNGTN